MVLCDCICSDQRHFLHTELGGTVWISLLTALYHPVKVKAVADDIAEYLISHYRQDISLELLCREFHFSKNYIIFLFKQKYEMTPFSYLLSIRLANAKSLLLNSTQTAEEIAFDCGFGDYSHFYKIFKKETGLSPNVWRKRHTDL